MISFLLLVSFRCLTGSLILFALFGVWVFEFEFYRELLISAWVFKAKICPLNSSLKIISLANQNFFSSRDFNSIFSQFKFLGLSFTQISPLPVSKENGKSPRLASRLWKNNFRDWSSMIVFLWDKCLSTGFQTRNDIRNSKDSKNLIWNEDMNVFLLQNCFIFENVLGNEE